MTDHIEDLPIKKKNRGGRPPNSIWEDINKGEAVGSGKFAAFLMEHPFFINFIKELNAGYNTPTREVLVNQLLERELAQVNFKVNSELEKETNLTLAFDGWTSGTHRSIWNFIVMILSRKEYLYQLSDLSENSHTAEYLVTVIEKVIEGIGEDRICAVVSDNAANVHNARKIIHENHPKIENVRCIAHSINLIACDIVKEKFGKRLLKCVNILTTFFRSSHQANAKLAQIIKEKGISGGGLKLYCKTRWTTASESVNSVINLESALEEMASDYDKVLTNDKIKPIIQSRNFFKFMSSWIYSGSSKKNGTFIRIEKSYTCRLFPELGKTCSYIKKVTQIIKSCIPKSLYQSFDRYEAETLCDQIQKYINEQEPFDLDIGFAKDNPMNWWKYINTEPEPDVLPRIASYLFAICPNSAICERGFSTLGWLFHKRHLNLNVDKLESMCKLILYWKSNSKTELGFYGIDQKKNTRLSDDEINIRIAEAFAEDDDEEYNEEQASTQRLTTSGETIFEDNCRVVIESLWIDQFVNLSHDSITSEIGDIPRDILDDSDENNAEDDEVDDSGNNKRPGEGDYDYDIDDVLGMDDGNNNDDNYDDNEE
ncbi:ribonuclease H-like domain-containing protein [Rhizophagus irregularis DAOM 181602=DAOM 197198]|nr:ribonuclease H-like domain-containing protein [Rhizophagus irregularis DAOM 181602=DAOM 197198]